MKTYSLTGEDLIKINDRIISDLADADAGAITFPNNIANVKFAKNGNALYANNATGKQADLVLRVVRGSADDRYLRNLLNVQKQNFAGTVLMNGEIIKNVGDGAGNIAQEKYILSGGVFTKEIDVKTNAEGDTEQSVAVYNATFGLDNSVIG
jgi:hypothetical protein